MALQPSIEEGRGPTELLGQVILRAVQSPELGSDVRSNMILQHAEEANADRNDPASTNRRLSVRDTCRPDRKGLTLSAWITCIRSWRSQSPEKSAHGWPGADDQLAVPPLSLAGPRSI